MKSFNKIFSVAALCSALALSINTSYALTITDVQTGHWAERAIIEAVQRNYLDVSGSEFRPNDPITRAEFANAVFNIIQRKPILNDGRFSDVSSKTPYSQSILTLNQLKVIFGYPNGTFEPNGKMKRSEAAVAVANVVRTDFWDKSVLDKFSDKEEIPSWAKLAYINDVVNDIYINHPNEDEFTPNQFLTRAQAAVLMVKLQTAVDNYKLSYMPQNHYKTVSNELFKNKIKPVLVAENTLGEFKGINQNSKVDLFDTRNVIEAGNVIPVKSMQKLNSRSVKEGEIVTYVSPRAVYSTEGTKLYDENTKFIGYVERVEHSYWRKKQDRAYIVFNKAILNDGTEFPIAGVLYSTYGGDVVLEKDKNSKKITKDINKEFKEQEKAIKLTKKLVPVLKYQEKAKNNVYMLVTADMIIPHSKSL